MPAATRFIVRRRNWRWSPGNEHTPRGWVCFPGPGHTVAEFDLSDEALADCGKREAAVRLKMNPFDCGSLPMLSSLPDPVLRDFLMDTGIEPPAVSMSWEAWWTANREQLSEEQSARLWAATDKVRFFEITEEPAGPEVHVVVDVLWATREQVNVADGDGGRVVRAFRHLQRAGEVLRSRSQELRSAIMELESADGVRPFANCRPCNVPDPFNPGSLRLTGLAQMPLTETATIPLDETRGPKRYLLRWGYPHRHRESDIYIVVRTEYVPGPQGFQVSEDGCGVPIKAFVDDDHAERFARELEVEARSWFNPFRLANIPELVMTRIAWGDDRSLSRGLVESCRLGGRHAPDGEKWEQWWTEQVMPLPLVERDELWDQLRVEFYTVIPVHFET